MRKIAVLAALVVGLVGALALSAQSALAGHLVCGQTVTGHVVLHADIGPCTGDGLVMGADSTRINLNGYRIFSDGNATVPDDGIDNLGAFNNVVIRGPGTIDGFNDNINIDGLSSADRVMNNKVVGVRLLNAEQDGISVDNVTGLVLRWNKSIGSGSSGFEIDGEFDGPGSVVEHNIARNSDGRGFEFESGGDVLVRFNKSINSGSQGIDTSTVTGRFVGNVVKDARTGEGFDVQGPGLVLVRNVVIGSGTAGNPVPGFNIRMGGNTLIGNAAKNNSGSGFFVEDRADDTRFIGNIALRNRMSGFAEEPGGSGTSTYRKNVAIWNTDYGILAPNGVAASSRNFVFGNGMGCSPGLSCFPQN